MRLRPGWNEGFYLRGAFLSGSLGKYNRLGREPGGTCEELVDREMERLRESFRQAAEAGYRSSSCSCIIRPPIFWRRRRFYRDRGGIWCYGGGILTLSWGEPVWRQYPGRFPGDPVHAGVGRLPAFSSGGSTAVKVQRNIR